MATLQQQLTVQTQAAAATVAIKALTGYMPEQTLQANGDVVVRFSDADAPLVKQKIIELLEVSSRGGSSTRKTPSVKFETANVVVPAALYWARWYIAGAVAAIGAVGYLCYRKGRADRRG